MTRISTVTLGMYKLSPVNQFISSVCFDCYSISTSQYDLNLPMKIDTCTRVRGPLGKAPGPLTRCNSLTARRAGPCSRIIQRNARCFVSERFSQSQARLDVIWCSRGHNL